MKIDDSMSVLLFFSEEELEDLIESSDPGEVVLGSFRRKMYERYPTAHPMTVETLLLVFQELCDLASLREGNPTISGNTFGRIMDNVLAKMTASKE